MRDDYPGLRPPARPDTGLLSFAAYGAFNLAARQLVEFLSTPLRLCVSALSSTPHPGLFGMST